MWHRSAWPDYRRNTKKKKMHCLEEKWKKKGGSTDSYRLLWWSKWTWKSAWLTTSSLLRRKDLKGTTRNNYWGIKSKCWTWVIRRQLLLSTSKWNQWNSTCAIETSALVTWKQKKKKWSNSWGILSKHIKTSWYSIKEARVSMGV